MNYFYLTTNTNRREPDVLLDKSYIHLKSSVDGWETMVLTEEEITDALCELKTQEEAQAILDSWVAIDNVTPFVNEAGDEVQEGGLSVESFL